MLREVCRHEKVMDCAGSGDVRDGGGADAGNQEAWHIRWYDALHHCRRPKPDSTWGELRAKLLGLCD